MCIRSGDCMPCIHSLGTRFAGYAVSRVCGSLGTQFAGYAVRWVEIGYLEKNKIYIIFKTFCA